MTKANEITLKGSMHGTKVHKKYKNPDIIESIVDTYHVCEINKLRISYKSDTKFFYMYHSYESINTKYSGRWYLTNYTFSEKDLDEKNYTFSVLLKSVNWEDWDTQKSVTKNVKIVIQLSEKGFHKLKSFLQKNSK